MIPITLKQLAEITQGTLYGTDITVLNVSTDTRKMHAGSLFIALKGKNYDAHDFISSAISAGCSSFLVNQKLCLPISHIVVNDTRIALGVLARWVRQQSGAKVVGITGSSGKTSVKEMTASILRQCGQVLSTSGTLNNDIGVPITLLRLTHEHQYAVIELGANHPGELFYTAALTQPESVLINNLSASHLEGFGSLVRLAKAKGEILQALPQNGTAIINHDSNDLVKWKYILQGQNIWCFSSNHIKCCDFYASCITRTQLNTHFNLHTPQGCISVMIPFHGQHYIANALAASALAMSISAPLNSISKGLQHLQAIPGRLFPIPFTKNKLLIDDTYNANVGSMIAAVNVLADRPGYRVMIVGNMAEMGHHSNIYHKQIGYKIRHSGINKVLSIGSLGHEIARTSNIGEYFEDPETLSARAHELLMKHQYITLLVKGSRSSNMDKIVQILQEHSTC
ncbi:UDP-N-acetylmuramoyl-tripeptide--D-alanyl-D-alanine ligase [Candidatus Erwinia haradaeae]|uniref:UDP-N-acetylmuramoyl-tripeptide--D-alanyl-D-alanine ligase n=1 Tax=Candidatus Erwinia haradaeae TaxID=1922217 RepID=A0A451DAB2_9GAMM|nr:UDP-N-acetylmuramoyl-tripeptide--D-alanyl-D-alanine ligase [Candidatus Erwinia haradaeae]VFP83145.1 UDP-N-acetylmuramoyl-tripeptide--D-alanyl-D-alanine ligase [Candidatus Erwinia haradaeae]